MSLVPCCNETGTLRTRYS